MSTILVVYEQAPPFPATDQSPAAARYTVDGRVVDALGGKPTTAELQAFLNPAPSVPEVISDRQFFQQCAVVGKISEDEAIAAVATGTIPPNLEAVVAALPEDQQFAARMFIQGATQFLRHHPMTVTLGYAMGMSDSEMDALWMAAAAL